MDRRDFLRAGLALGAAALPNMAGGEPVAREEQPSTHEAVPVTLGNALPVRALVHNGDQWTEVSGYWTGEERQRVWANEPQPNAVGMIPITLVQVVNETDAEDRPLTREVPYGRTGRTRTVPVQRIVFHDAYIDPNTVREPHPKTAERLREEADAQRVKYWQILANDEAGVVRPIEGKYYDRAPEAGEEPIVEGSLPAQVQVVDPVTNQVDIVRGWAMTIPLRKEEEEEKPNCCAARTVYIDTTTGKVDVDPTARFEIITNVDVDVEVNVEVEEQDWFPDYCTCRTTRQRRRIQGYYSTNVRGLYAYNCPNTGRPVYFRNRRGPVSGHFHRSGGFGQ